jgi:hypothetical protein
VDSRASGTRDDLRPPTKAELDPVDPSVKTAVAAGMEGRLTVLVCCPMAIEYKCVVEELTNLWMFARRSNEQTKRNPQLAAIDRELKELLSTLPETSSQIVPDQIDPSHELTALAGLEIPNISCRLHRKTILIIQSGLGRGTTNNASQLVWNFDRVWLIGFAGALDPSLSVGDIVEPSSVHSINPVDAPIVLAPVGVYLLSPPMVTSSEPLATPFDKASLLAKSQCAAVDMEAYGLAKVCQVYGKSFHTARAISDDASDAFPKELNGILLPSGDLSIWRLVVAMLKKPTLLRPLLRLWNNSKRAKTSLRLITRRLVEQLA